MGTKQGRKESKHHHHFRPSAKQNIINAWRAFKLLVRDTCTPPKYEFLAPPLCERAFFIIPKTSLIRRQAIILAHWRAFEYATLLAIIANCIVLTMDSNAPGFLETSRGQQLLRADYVFTGFFTLEALTKMLSQGLAFAPNTYMRNAWNFLDIIIVATGYISLAGFANVTALRAIRALRPLRAITRIKNMKLVVSTLLSSTTLLLDMFVLTAFFLAIFGTMCVQLFGGQLRGRCGLPDFSAAYTDELGVVHGVEYFVPDEEVEFVCRHPMTANTMWRNTTDPDTGLVRLIASGFDSSLDARDCAFNPPEGMEFGLYCTPFGNPGAIGFGDESIGYWSFDNILLSWIVIFQHMTMGNWAFNMYFTQDGVNWWTWVLHFTIIFLGGMILINLALAVIFMNYERIKAETAKALEEARRQEELENAAKVTFTSVLTRALSAKRPLMESSQQPGRPDLALVKQMSIAAGVRQRAAGPTDAALLACRKRARANWRKAGMLALPCKSVALIQMCANAKARDAASHPLVQLSAWRYNTSGRIRLPDAPKQAPAAAPASDLPPFPDLSESSESEGEYEMYSDEEEDEDDDADTVPRLKRSQAGKPAQLAADDGAGGTGLQAAGAAAPVALTREKSGRKALRGRGVGKRIKKWCFRVSSSPNFDLANALAICVNAVVLGMKWYLMPSSLSFGMSIANSCFTVYFVVETNIRMIGLGPDLFFATFMNSFGYVVSHASLSEMIVALEPSGPDGIFNGALTVIRLLRLLKLARYWKGLKMVLRILGYAIRSGIYLLMLVLLFMFVMGLLGLQLFGHKATFCDHIDGGFQACPPGVIDCPAHRDCFVTCSAEQQGQWFEVEDSPYGGMAYCERFPRDESSPREAVFWAQVGKPQRMPFHFDDMFHAFITVFVIITLDNWTNIMFPIMNRLTPWAAIYFIFCVVIGAFMMLQLFLAILLSGLDELEKEMKAEKDTESFASVWRASSVAVVGRGMSKSMKQGLTFLGGGLMGSRGQKPGAADELLLKNTLANSSGAAKKRKNSLEEFAAHFIRSHSAKPKALSRLGSSPGGAVDAAEDGAEGGAAKPEDTGPEASSELPRKFGMLPPLFSGKASNRVSPAPMPVAHAPPLLPAPSAPDDAALPAADEAAFAGGQGPILNSEPLPRHLLPSLQPRNESGVADSSDGGGFGSGGFGSARRLHALGGTSRDRDSGHIKRPPLRNASMQAWTGPASKQPPSKPTTRRDVPDDALSTIKAANASAAAAAAEAAAAGGAALAGNDALPLTHAVLHGNVDDNGEINVLRDADQASASSSTTSVHAPSTPSKHAPGSSSQGSLRPSSGGSGSSSTLSAAATVAAAAAAVAEGTDTAEQLACIPGAHDGGVLLPPAPSPLDHTQHHPRQAQLTARLHSAEPLDPADWPRQLPSVTAMLNKSRAAEECREDPGHGCSPPSSAPSSSRAIPAHSSCGPRAPSPPPPPPPLRAAPWALLPAQLDQARHPFVAALRHADMGGSAAFLEGSDGGDCSGHVRTGQGSGIKFVDRENEDKEVEGEQADARGLGLRALGLGAPKGAALSAAAAPDDSVAAAATRTLSHVLARRQQNVLEAEAAKKAAGLRGMWDEDVLKGTSCYCLGPNNKLRIAAAKVITHRSFELIIIITCIASSVILALDNYTLERTSFKATVLRNLDASFTAIFGLETVLKAVAMGVLFNGSDSYFRSGWNLADTFVVVISVVVLVVEATVSTKEVPWLRALRAMRAIRVLRVSMKVPGVKVVVEALRQLIPALFNTLAVGCLFFYIFAILAVALLNGRMHYCANEATKEYIDPYYVLPVGETIFKGWCEATDIHRSGTRTITTSHYHSQLGVEVPAWEMTTSWRRELRRFDNIFNALWVLFQMASVEKWSEIMFYAQMATEIEEQPMRDANRFIAFFFVLFMFVSSFVVLNLLIGVSILKFNEMKDANDGKSPFLTSQQSQWLSIQQMLSATSFESSAPPAANPFRKLVHAAIYNKVMDNLMMFIILANTFVMFLAHSGMNSTWVMAINMTNLIVTIIFTVEMICKLIAIGIRPYIKSNWNCFDAFITALSIVGVLIDNLSEDTVSFLPVLRALRIARIFRLIPRAKGLRKLMRTLYWSIPAVTNVAYVLFLLMYLWAIVGMNLWGNIKQIRSGEGINRHVNFRYFPVSMITEFRMITGEEWNDIMEAAMVREDCLMVLQDVSVVVPTVNSTLEQVTLFKGQYLDPINDGRTISALPSNALEDQCSLEPFLAVLYFCTFMLVCSYILLQLVIGIILDSIQAATMYDFLSIGPDDVQAFMNSWEKLDPYSTSYISVWQLPALLAMIPPSLGVKGLSRQQSHITDIIYTTDIPLRSLRVHFLEVLHALAGRIAGAELPAEEELRIHDKLVKSIPKDMPRYFAAHAFAALAVGGAVRGFLHRRKLMETGEWAEANAFITPRGSLDASVSTSLSVLASRPSVGLSLKPSALSIYYQQKTSPVGMQKRLQSNLETHARDVLLKRQEVIEAANKELEDAQQQRQQQQVQDAGGADGRAAEGAQQGKAWVGWVDSPQPVEEGEDGMEGGLEPGGVGGHGGEQGQPQGRPGSVLGLNTGSAMARGLPQPSQGPGARTHLASLAGIPPLLQHSGSSAGPRSRDRGAQKAAPTRPPARVQLPRLAGPRTAAVKLPPVRPLKQPPQPLQSPQLQQEQEQRQPWQGSQEEQQL